MAGDLTEDKLVQQTTAAFLHEELQWDACLFAQGETFGPSSMLGRNDAREVVLRPRLREALKMLNPGYADRVYEAAVQTLCEVSSSKSLNDINREKYALMLDGIPVEVADGAGKHKTVRLRVFDFKFPEHNRFLCVREFKVRGALYERRADVMGFVNGIPLVFMELKNVCKDVREAYDNNFRDYLKTVPQLFYFNAFVILSNGIDARIGTHSAPYRFFHAWKRLSEEEPGVVDMETMLRGTCTRANLMDLFENFILFDASAGAPVKILARNHQFLGVNRAVAAVEARGMSAEKRRLGVFWHTQGSGKSYSMVFFTRKVRRWLGGHFTFVILTDREELDTQIYKTFAGCGVIRQSDACRAGSGRQLQEMLQSPQGYVFSLIQKFNRPTTPGEHYTDRSDVIVISDEAHRSQYGQFALNLRNALPNAGYIGFTGTPLFKDDELTRKVFGDYVSRYDFQRAVEDGATVPLYYDARGDKLRLTTTELNEKIASALEEADLDDPDVLARLEGELSREYHMITAPKRLEQVARDFAEHYSTRWESGKVMFVCIDKATCVRMYDLITAAWKQRIESLRKELKQVDDEQERLFRLRQIRWMEETTAAVIVSRELNEDEKFARWGLDISKHRRIMEQGMEIPEAYRDDPRYAGRVRMSVEEAFKFAPHPFRIAIVCAMWLTGFDAPSVSALYLDKPLKAHTLMQAIARANRVAEGKNNGLIVDYIGILKHLQQALATYAGGEDGGGGGSGDGDVPVKSEEELIATLEEAIRAVRDWLAAHGAPLDDIIGKTGFAKNAALQAAKEAANASGATRKRFEVMCRVVFRIFKACLMLKGVHRFSEDYAAINLIYKMLQEGRRDADISEVMQVLQGIVDEAVDTQPAALDLRESDELYDLSRIDFEALRKRFEKTPAKRTAIIGIQQVIEAKLKRLLEKNPLRTDFQKHYEQMIEEYNRDKDSKTIEQAFEDLVAFVKQLTTEEARAAREGLTEETLAIYDLLLSKKGNLSAKDIRRVKEVAVSLLATLKRDALTIDNWREKDSGQSNVKTVILNWLYDETTGLPASYGLDEINLYAEDVYRHIFTHYPSLPSPYYASA